MNRDSELVNKLVDLQLAAGTYNQIVSWACFSIRDYFSREQTEEFLNEYSFEELLVQARKYLIELYTNYYSDEEFEELKHRLLPSNFKTES
jgi:hypothetical protein